MRRTVIAIGIVVLCAAGLAQAKSSYLSAFKTRYSINNGNRLDTCNLCHVLGQSYSVRNPYGIDLNNNNIKNNTSAAFAAVEPMDSDGDTFSNLLEITYFKFPGDPTDIVPVEETSWGRIKALYESQ